MSTFTFKLNICIKYLFQYLFQELGGIFFSLFSTHVIIPSNGTNKLLLLLLLNFQMPTLIISSYLASPSVLPRKTTTTTTTNKQTKQSKANKNHILLLDHSEPHESLALIIFKVAHPTWWEATFMGLLGPPFTLCQQRNLLYPNLGMIIRVTQRK